MTESRQPVLRHITPGSNENRWSDLLATLIETDPTPMTQFLGLEPDGVRREVAISDGKSRRSDRLDLLLTRGGEQLAAIEIKVLSDLGLDQLARYESAFPDAATYHVLHLGALPVNVRSHALWHSLTWEDVLAAYARSTNDWVATTARAWLDQMDTLVPRVDAETIWNDVPDDVPGFELALRARIAWLSSHLGDSSLGCDIVQSSGGGSWVLRLWADTAVADLRVQVEVQEGMTAYEWRFDPDQRYRERVRGPAPLVGLRLNNIDTSESFDWGLLHRVFTRHVLDDEGAPLPDWPWQLTSANPRHPVDRVGWNAMVEAGGPRWLGKGFGMAVATKHYRECLFGARMQLAPALTLGAMRAEILRLEPLILAMAGTLSVLGDGAP